MNIVLNGQDQIVDVGTNVTQLVATLDRDPRGVAIERNLEIVPKSQWDATILQEGDRLELVQFVGGGL
jgi:sulfur carrier protein